MKAPLTEQNIAAWDAMCASGMKREHAWNNLADWARMLEERVAELDPHYTAYQWGRQKEAQ